MSDFRKLLVWRKAHVLALRVDRVAGTLQRPTDASLKNQMTRAAMSIPTNIVEGSSQETRKDFKRFLRYASNSATELEYHLLLARDKGAITTGDYANLSARTVEVRKMLIGLMKRVEQTL